VKKYRLIINAFAKADLEIATDWYASRSEALSQEFIDEIDKTFQRIQNNPLLFAVVRKQIRMSIVKRFPYGVYFYIAGDIINVFGVFHFSRNPKVLRKRVTPIVKKK
jgi:plasmid stabilization system protein ParE